MAGLDPAIPFRKAQCHVNRDHRVTALRAGPVTTAETDLATNHSTNETVALNKRVRWEEIT
jgi:hypothetical protein